MIPEISTGTHWKYTGVSGGQGLIHRVTSVDTTEISTWSEPVNDTGIGGYSWLGSPDQFIAEFVPA